MSKIKWQDKGNLTPCHIHPAVQKELILKLESL